jgi:hypothetical protein
MNRFSLYMVIATTSATLASCGGSSDKSSTDPVTTDPASIEIKPLYTTQSVTYDTTTYSGSDTALILNQTAAGSISSIYHSYLFTAEADGYTVLKLDGTTGIDIDLEIYEDSDLITDGSSYLASEQVLFKVASGHQYQIIIINYSDFYTSTYTLTLSQPTRDVLELTDGDHVAVENSTYTGGCVIEGVETYTESGKETLVWLANFDKKLAMDINADSSDGTLLSNLTSTGFTISSAYDYDDLYPEAPYINNGSSVYKYRFKSDYSGATSTGVDIQNYSENTIIDPERTCTWNSTSDVVFVL